MTSDINTTTMDSKHLLIPQVVDGNGFDGLRNRVNDSWYTDAEHRRPEDESMIRSQRSSQSKPVLDDLTNFRNSVTGKQTKGRRSNIPEELETGSETFYELDDKSMPPPKVTESISLTNYRSRNKNQRNSLEPSNISKLSQFSGDRYRCTSLDSSDWSRMEEKSGRVYGHLSPSKVGSMMWGHTTPLKNKGHPPIVDHEMWCCAVCLYMDNPRHSPKCQVCDSPNYGERKVRRNVIQNILSSY
jgi:hypothetical protein